MLDAKGHHPASCAAGGDRTQRHNALRDLVAEHAARAGLRPELERPGVLLPQRPEDTHVARRRPADIFLPTWVGGSPVALDFAITAPQRQETLARAAEEDLAAAAAYAARKAAFEGTAEACAAQGVRFCPMVAESTGAWEPEAERVLRRISRTAAARNGTDPAAAWTLFQQQTSVLLRRARAQAELRRRDDPMAGGGPASPPAAQ